MKTCLIVDDSKVVRMVARKILEGLNFEIAEAEDGQQALDLIAASSFEPLVDARCRSTTARSIVRVASSCRRRR